MSLIAEEHEVDEHEIDEHSDTEQGTELYPLWKQTAKDIARVFDYGDLIPHEWINNKLGVVYPNMFTLEEYKKISFARLTAIEKLKDELLENYQMDLYSDRGVGYRIVTPMQQTNLAVSDMETKLKKAIKKTVARLSNVNYSFIDNDEKNRNSEAIGRMAAIRAFTAKKIKLIENKKINIKRTN